MLEQNPPFGLTDLRFAHSKVVSDFVLDSVGYHLFKLLSRMHFDTLLVLCAAARRVMTGSNRGLLRQKGSCTVTRQVRHADRGTRVWRSR
jgi:hypothetical protein